MKKSSIYRLLDFRCFVPKIPYHCLHTGTPVVGGMTYNQLAYMLDHVHRTRHVIGAELVEVGAPNETPYDATVGARLIQLLAGVVAHPR